MTGSIWKYPIQITDEVILSMPRSAQILSVQVQKGVPCIWALVDPTQPKTDRRFRIYGTGHPVDETRHFIGTFQLHGGSLVFHLFDVTLQENQ